MLLKLDVSLLVTVDATDVELVEVIETAHK